MLNDHPTMKERQAVLERALIDDYLDWCGHTRQSVHALPEAEATALLRAASAEYASLRLAEIDSRGHCVDEIHRPS